MSFSECTVSFLTTHVGCEIPVDISHTEIFGPAVGIIRFKTDEEAIVLANRTEYGLAAAVHSRNVERALKVAKRIDASQVHVNSFTIHDHPVRSLKLFYHSFSLTDLLFSSYVSIILMVDGKRADTADSTVLKASASLHKPRYA